MGHWRHSTRPSSLRPTSVAQSRWTGWLHSQQIQSVGIVSSSRWQHKKLLAHLVMFDCCVFVELSWVDHTNQCGRLFVFDVFSIIDTLCWQIESTIHSLKLKFGLMHLRCLLEEPLLYNYPLVTIKAACNTRSLTGYDSLLFNAQSVFSEQTLHFLQQKSGQWSGFWKTLDLPK